MLTDRTRIIDFQRCPRRRYWRYHFDQTGIEPQLTAKALTTGKLTHEGIDRLILGNDPDNTIADILDLAEGEFTAETPGRIEQLWLIEALLWAFHVRGLPQLQAQYEIIDTEREEELPLSEGLTLMARTDAILKEKETGDIYLGSWKTTATYDQRKELYQRHDMQGISEPLAVEHRLKQPVVGVQMVYLVKGWEKKQDDGSTQLQSELVYGYMKDDTWAHSYNWTCKEPHDKCPGRANHRLGKGWEKYPINTCYSGGIKQWICDISQDLIQSNAQESSTFLDKYIIMPPPLNRSELERARWKNQTICQEKRLEKGLEMVKAYNSTPGDLAFVMDEYFPLYEHSCEYPGRCPFWDLCHLPSSEVSPYERGFKPRDPNHPQEKFGIED